MSEQHNAPSPSAPPSSPHTPASYDRRASAPRHDATPSRVGHIVIGSALLVGVAIATIALLATRKTAAAARETNALTTDEAKGKLVRVADVTLSPSIARRELLGEARPFASVTFYAKVSGYLRTVDVDMGDRVSPGQVMATIESPETDRAYLAAKADYDNKQVLSTRISQLLAKKMVSPQEADQARADAAVAQERVNALKEEQEYETLRAPFNGRVTARYADPGALVQNAASSQTSALPVVTVAQTDSLRVFVYLDQGDAARVRVGTPATITLTERPGFSLPARVARIAGELDPKTRKMMTEIDVHDQSGTIVPGGFVNVSLDIPIAAQPQAPVEALLVRGQSTMVATVGADSRVHFKPVVVAGNDGKMLTFVKGVAPGDRVALSLGNAVPDGSQIQVDSNVAVRDQGVALQGKGGK